jgi:hypothetical protein
MHVYRSVSDALELGNRGLRARSKNSYCKTVRWSLDRCQRIPSTPAKALHIAPTARRPRLSGFERLLYV